MYKEAQRNHAVLPAITWHLVYCTALQFMSMRWVRSHYRDSWQLYSLTFKFHMVVRQQNSGLVEDFIVPYVTVYIWMQKWKNCWNLSTFANVIVIK